MASTAAPTVAGLIRERHLHWLVGSDCWRCYDTAKLRLTCIFFGEILFRKLVARETSLSQLKDKAKFTQLRARLWKPSHSSLVQFSLSPFWLAIAAASSLLDSVTHAQPYEVRKKPLPPLTPKRTPRLHVRTPSSFYAGRDSH